jgi:hypothetical protein
MNIRFRSKIISILILSLLLFGEVSPVSATPLPVIQDDFNISDVIPGARLISGWLGRNQTYRSADQFMIERNQYYDGLRNTLRKELQNRSILTLRKSQLAAYIKEVSLIEGERASAIQFAEGIKKGARHDFAQAVKQELLNRVMATGMMTQVFGAITTGFSQAQIFIDGAINELGSGGSIGDAIGKLDTVTFQLRVATGLFGGKFGADLRDKLEQITGRIKKQVAMTKQDLIDVKAQMTDVQNRITALEAQKRLPASSQVQQDLALQLVGWGSGTPATDAILGLLGRRSGLSLDQVHTRGMALLEAGDIARCQQKAAALINELRKLKNKDTNEDLADVNAEELCKEVKAKDLFPEVGISTLPVKTPKATATVGEVDTRVKFLDSDCPNENLPKPTEYIDMGSLTCDYSIPGANGSTSERFSIKQVNDPTEIQNEFASSKDYAQKQISFYQNNKPNANLTILKNDREDNLYLITYDGDKPPNSTQVPLCVFAGGNQIVDGKFITGFLFTSCSLGNSASDYQTVFQGLVDAATTAIDRAESGGNP